MGMINKDVKIVLASNSPRRKELLGLIFSEFEVCALDVDETVTSGTPPDKTVEQLAMKKAYAVAEKYPDCVVIGSDTVVALDNEILGKPRDEAHAKEMLKMLSHRSHKVYTGVSVVWGGNCYFFSESTSVTFAKMSTEQIDAYVATGEPMDKAGAYGIQGKAALFISSISGDYYTVMGLPVCRLAALLHEIGLV